MISLFQFTSTLIVIVAYLNSESSYKKKGNKIKCKLNNLKLNYFRRIESIRLERPIFKKQYMVIFL